MSIDTLIWITAISLTTSICSIYLCFKYKAQLNYYEAISEETEEEI